MYLRIAAIFLFQDMAQCAGCTLFTVNRHNEFHNNPPNVKGYLINPGFLIPFQCMRDNLSQVVRLVEVAGDLAVQCLAGDAVAFLTLLTPGY